MQFVLSSNDVFVFKFVYVVYLYEFIYVSNFATAIGE